MLKAGLRDEIQGPNRLRAHNLFDRIVIKKMVGETGTNHQSKMFLVSYFPYEVSRESI